MSTPSDPSASLQAQTDLNVAGFVRTELELAFTFSTIAATKYEAGNPSSAKQSMANAEKAYKTVDRYLCDPKHSTHLTVEEIHDMRAELRRLRGRLDELLQPASLQAQTDLNVAGFVRTELELALTFSTIAATKYEAGNPSSAKKSMANAEKAYKTVDRYLCDPKHSTHLTVEEIHDMRAELRRLRGRLDELLQPASLQAQTDLNVAGFVRTELELAFTFSTIAATKYEAGNPSSAKQSMANAEKAYKTVDRYLCDPKHSTHLTVEEIHDMRAGLRRLRGRLDELLQQFKK